MTTVLSSPSSIQLQELLKTLEERFESNPTRHKDVDWNLVKHKLEQNQERLETLYHMEQTGGEPDVVQFNSNTNEHIFYDCSKESPKGRRSLCYDELALKSRKEHKPKNSALALATSLGAEILTFEDYKFLQTLGDFDNSTSSWIQTPKQIRDLGGALFCDKRYATVFVYHNGAESYYASRGFRAKLVV